MKTTKKTRIMEAVTHQVADAMRENLSPQAVAAIATYLMAGRTANKEVAREIEWFTNLLVGDLLGGPEALDQLVKEAGL